MNHAIILDVEASGLGDNSFPIEIGWVNRFNRRDNDSFLLCPDPSWTFWDDYAEETIHRISRACLLEEGIDVVNACHRLNNSLKGQRILSDAAQTDRFWIQKLFSCADIQCEFSIGSIYELIPGDKADVFQRRLKKENVPHRALEDARAIAKCVNFVCA